MIMPRLAVAGNQIQPLKMAPVYRLSGYIIAPTDSDPVVPMFLSVMANDG